MECTPPLLPHYIHYSLWTIEHINISNNSTAHLRKHISIIQQAKEKEVSLQQFHLAPFSLQPFTDYTSFYYAHLRFTWPRDSSKFSLMQNFHLWVFYFIVSSTFSSSPTAPHPLMLLSFDFLFLFPANTLIDYLVLISSK